jgi:hypothetical protein
MGLAATATAKEMRKRDLMNFIVLVEMCKVQAIIGARG